MVEVHWGLVGRNTNKESQIFWMECVDFLGEIFRANMFKIEINSPREELGSHFRIFMRTRNLRDNQKYYTQMP